LPSTCVYTLYAGLLNILLKYNYDDCGIQNVDGHHHHHRKQEEEKNILNKLAVRKVSSAKRQIVTTTITVEMKNTNSADLLKSSSQKQLY